MSTASANTPAHRPLMVKDHVHHSRRMLNTKYDATHDSWAMLTKLFDVWDMDNNGFIDQRELFVGLGRYCRVQNIHLEKESVLRILSLVDINHDHRLDRREFSVFLARFADSLGINLFDLTVVVMEQLADRHDDDMVRIETRKVVKTTNRKKYGGFLRLFDGLKEEQVGRKSLC